MPKTTHANDSSRHTSDVNCLLFHAGKLYSGADDGKIKVWDENLKPLATIEDAHTKSVFAIAASTDTLYSGSNDGTIKSWSLRDLKPKKTLSSGNREIAKLCFVNDTLFVGDSNGTVEVYVHDHLVAARNLFEPIRGLLVQNNFLYTVQELDLIIRMLKSKYGDFERRKTIMGSAPMCIAGDKLLYCTRSGRDVCLRENSVELNFKFVSETLDVHDDRIHAMLGNVKDYDTLFFTGGGDKVVKQWKVDGKCIIKQQNAPTKAGVNILEKGSKGEIYVGCRDGHMCRLDF